MTLIIVYNANIGLVNQSFDWLHRVVSPDTYACSLCKLTHGHFGAKTSWDNFIHEQDFDVCIYHKDEFNNVFPTSGLIFPWIGLKNEHGFLETLLNAEHLNQTKSLDDLVLILNQKLIQLIVK